MAYNVILISMGKINRKNDSVTKETEKVNSLFNYV